MNSFGQPCRTFNLDSPHWESFLERNMEGNRDLLTFIQRAVGYTITGSTSERCMFILHGVGKNGKTVFLEGMRLLLGDGYTARTPTQTLLSKRGDTIPNDIARLRGVRLVTPSETGDGNRLDEALIKDLSGGDRSPGDGFDSAVDTQHKVAGTLRCAVSQGSMCNSLNTADGTWNEPATMSLRRLRSVGNRQWQ